MGLWMILKLLKLKGKRRRKEESVVVEGPCLGAMKEMQCTAAVNSNNCLLVQKPFNTTGKGSFIVQRPYIKLMLTSQVMEGITGNSKNVPKKSTRLGRMMDFRQYTLRLRCEPKSLQPPCTKFSNFVPILDTSTFTNPSFISSGFKKIRQS